MRAYVRVGVYTLSPLQACVPLHVSVFANVCNFLFLCESVCIGTGEKNKKYSYTANIPTMRANPSSSYNKNHKDS